MGEDQETVAPEKVGFPSLKRRRQLEHDLAHITQEMYRRNKELAETNKTLSLLRTIDALVLESHASLKTVCEHITEAITQTTDYAFVGLLTRSSHNSKDELTLNGWSGSAWLGQNKPEVLARPIHVSTAHPWFSEFRTSTLVSLDSLPNKVIAGFLHCSEKEIDRLQGLLSLKSIYAVKLLARRRIVGLLVIGFYNPIVQLNQNDMERMDRVSESVGVALDNKLLFEENQYVLRQLRESNAKLKELDETKDDFISMASHQLRTPLTSVKGYLSMVLEEDAGKLNKMQREMLGQAFFSSQRMVYLIADLLNVSRLKTGKFIIEPAPVNLAEVVEQEIGQLKDMAASRALTLTYDKPDEFPELNLDETKTRQVIMNFVDNAIYYTPAGGHVAVRLINNQSTVELQVEDDGIGVPRSEKPHLFTKFYRAGNARKARPDGTGLGLFMAKKVVVAQGGAIIFESHEGKGSTFGFIFSKNKLAVSREKTAPAGASAVKKPTDEK
jgi:signal transduction histidine kinase